MRRFAAITTIVVAATGCGDRHPRVSPAALHGEVADAIGDAQPGFGAPTGPDLVAATIDVVGRKATFAVRFAPGTFDGGSTRVTIQLDTDGTPSTGMPTAYGLGIDYIVDMWPPSRRAVIQRANRPPIGASACNPCYVATGAVRLALTADGMQATVPLSRLGNGSGAMNFRILAYASPPGGASPLPTIVSDVMPDPTLPPGFVR